MAEALACGTPVVTTPRGAAPEIVRAGRTGFLCQDLESTVAALASVGGLSREACRADVEERFSIRRMAQDHVALYEQVLSGGVRRPEGGPPRHAPANGVGAARPG